MIRFEWDDSKNRQNIAKHRISFEEASAVFYDDNALLIHDPGHSFPGENRFIILGVSSALNLLVVCHCYRETDERIRLISARRASRNEAAQYTERLDRGE